GVSGAGHTVDEAFLYGSIDESVRPYGVPKHRHTPEIAQEAALLLGAQPRLTFTPHLVPMTRGLIATCYAPLRSGKTAKDVAETYAREYSEEPFVRVVGTYPATKATLASNWCLVHAIVDESTSRLVVFGVRAMLSAWSRPPRTRSAARPTTSRWREPGSSGCPSRSTGSRARSGR